MNKKAFQEDAYCLLTLTVCASIATRCQHRWERSEAKFIQVFNNGQHMSLVEGPCPVRSYVQRGWLGLGWSGVGGGYPSSEVKCIMGNGHMGPPLWTE